MMPTLEVGEAGADLNQLSPRYYSLGPALLQPTPSGQTLRPDPASLSAGISRSALNSDFAGDTYYQLPAGHCRTDASPRVPRSLANYSWSKLISNAEGISTYS